MPSDDKLRDSEEQLRLATEAAEVGLWDWDVATDTLYWPPRVKAMFGISPDVPVTMADYYSGLHPDDRAATLDALADALDVDRKATYDVEYRTIGKEDGVIRWVAAKGKAIFDGGRCARVIGTAIDITAATPYTRPWGDSLEHPTRHRGIQEVIPTVCGATVPRHHRYTRRISCQLSSPFG